MRPTHTLADLVAMFRVPPATVVAWVVETGHLIHFENGRYYVPAEAVAKLCEEHSQAPPPSRYPTKGA